VGLVPVAAAVLPLSERVLLWAAERPTIFGAEGDNPDDTLTAIYDPGTGKLGHVKGDHLRHGMFCPGISMSALGYPFVTGGKTAPATSYYISGYGNGEEEEGFSRSKGWVKGPNMTVGRGYHSQATLSDGRIFTIGGSWSGGVGGDPEQVAPKSGEVYDPEENVWRRLEGCAVEPLYTKGSMGTFEADNHAWLFAWSNASVFQAGPSQAMNWYDTHDSGAQQSAGQRGVDTDAMNGNAVMYDASRGEILTLGGAPSYSNSPASNVAHIITLSSPNAPPDVEEIGPMHRPRAYANSVVLPSGHVFINGGASWAKQWEEQNTTWLPEMWDPATKEFALMARSPISRTYHSFALLLPDATVLTGGSGMCYVKCEDDSVNHQDVQVFSPPYLFQRDGSLAQRPKIISISKATISPGSALQVVTNVGVDEFALVRYGSATHSINTDQRRIPLVPTSRSGRHHGSWRRMYELVVLDDPGILVPGYWMLFVMDSYGVPSVAERLLVDVVR